MARYSGAQWRPISINYNQGGIAPRILIVHIMQGTLAGTDSWFRNPDAQASAHFGVGKTGTIYQWVDTGNRAWHAVNANSYAIGVECAGFSGQTLTAAQVSAVARIYAWAHRHHQAISMWLNKRISGSGLSWHGLGGVAWGNHPNCPGTPIIDQLPVIRSKARAILNPAAA
ncbi:MAG TPA: peptidoglycan recognition family protein [Streptosporangiaceae bacterium]